ncbi:MAG: septum formation family protein [Chloroflexi bacterium]|nr:septum formation family protein [Chloroflexota bacterium]
MQGWVFRIGIIAVIAVGAIIFRDRLSGGAGDLKIGECFDEPVGVEEVSDVQHHPCTEAHTAEVVFLGDMTGANETYPAESAFEDFLVKNCVPAWEAYTGKTLQTDPVLTLGYFVPTTSSWGDGDHMITCHAARIDGAPMTSSVRKP